MGNQIQILHHRLSEKLHRRLLLGRTWRYLRYLHLRDALQKIQNDVESVLVCGAGHGFAELLLAIEFENIKFYLTDIHTKDGSYPNFFDSMKLSWSYQVTNIQFSIFDVLEPCSMRFDLVCSTEVLEHIENDQLAAANMRKCANKFIYALVPFATDSDNCDSKLIEKAWESHRHYRVGYTESELSKMFPSPTFIAGTYYSDAGLILRGTLNSLSDKEIIERQANLCELAVSDLKNLPPTPLGGHQGIKILSPA